MNRREVIVLLVAAGIPKVRAQNLTVVAPRTFERGLMGTRFVIQCHADDAAAASTAADAAFARAQQINDVASDYIADSELLNISKQPHGKPVTVSPLLFQLISEARGMAEKTRGCFDPTFGPLTHLWRECRRRNALPAQRDLTAARDACGWQDLLLDAGHSTVTFLKPNMRLDLGGIAKGQAADAMLDELKRHGLSSTCITAGGDIRVGDPPPGAIGWNIGVRTFDTKDDSRTLVLANRAVSTSGSLYQFVEIGGTRYSHIIDPTTGLGLIRKVAATVIAPSATLSDALATACCTAPPDKARQMALAAGASEVYLET